MRKLLIAIGVALGLSTAMMSCDRTNKDVTVLPEQAQATLKNDFKTDVSNIEIDKKRGVVQEYEVRLMNGTKVDFDTLGVWTHIDVMPGKEVPNTLIPDTILNHIRANYPDVKISAIEKEPYGYEVELSNDMELKFDQNGGFISRKAD